MCSIKYIKKDMIAGTSSSICAPWVNFKHSLVFSGRNQRWWEGMIYDLRSTIYDDKNNNNDSNDYSRWKLLQPILKQKSENDAKDSDVDDNENSDDIDDNDDV